MKTLMTLILFVSASVHATEIANYRFGVRDLDSNEVTVLTVKLDEDQILSVSGGTYSHQRGTIYFPDAVEIVEGSKKLNKLTYQQLVQEIQILSLANIHETTAQAVCMMIPGPTQSNNHLMVRREFEHRHHQYLSEMKLVSGPSGCWVVNHVQPEHDYQKRSATKLKETLKILALEVVDL